MKRNKIVFVGRSNVGKSSTIKALTGARIKIGKRPGVTLKPNFIPYGNFKIVDMPGFGFMAGVSKRRQDEIKDFIVHYLEKSEDILFAVQITDAKAFAEIARRHQAKGEVPVEIEMFQFLQELNLNPILVANKIDKVSKEKRDDLLDEMCELLGLPRPWRNHSSILVPFSAKTGGGIDEFKKLFKERTLNRHF